MGIREGQEAGRVCRIVPRTHWGPYGGGGNSDDNDDDDDDELVQRFRIPILPSDQVRVGVKELPYRARIRVQGPIEARRISPSCKRIPHMLIFLVEALVGLVRFKSGWQWDHEVVVWGHRSDHPFVTSPTGQSPYRP